MVTSLKLLVTSLFLVYLTLEYTDGLAVMSVDLGSEYMKIAIVKPGVPMEIVLNKESQRKTATAVSLRNGDRLFSDPALTVGVKYPQNMYWYLHNVIGKKVDHPHVLRFQEMFPYYKIKEDPDTGMVIFMHDEEAEYTPEELVAMVLEKAKESAEAFTEQSIKDVVITVPVFFNQAERRALLRAAELAGLNVLQLMNDNAAVALNYGVFRRKEFNSTVQNYLFYDMGATSTTATIVSYQVVKMKDRGFEEKNPQLTIRGVGFDASLGGLEFQLRLRDHLAKAFNNQKKTKSDVLKNNRAMGKLLKEAGRLKKVLSANSEHFAQIEGLLNDIDFRHKVTREEFETMCADLFDRAGQPVLDALKSSEMSMDEITEVILMGGGTRVPKVQEKLLLVTGRKDLGKSINTDEAAAMGAVYQAAYLSKGYKVKRFGVKEAVIFPIQVEFEREITNEDETKSTKTVKRVIFGRMNPYPQSKVMKFNKNFDDFKFDVMYGDLSFLPEAEAKAFGDQILSKVAVTGVGDMYKKYSPDSEFKGVKAHFRMDENGMLNLDLVDTVFEKVPPSGDEKDEESTLSKLGNTISSLFGGGKEEKKEPAEEPKTADTKEESKNEKPAETEQKEPTGKKAETDEKTTEEAKKEDVPKAEESKDETKQDNANKTDESKTDNNKTVEEKKEEKPKPKPIIIKEKLTTTQTSHDIKDPSEEKIEASRKKVADLKQRDLEKAKLEHAINELEGFIFTMRDNLETSDFEKCSTEDERTVLRGKLNEASDWLEEQGMETKADEYEAKLRQLQSATKDLVYRVNELKERPRALDALKSMLNHSDFFLKSIKNLTKDEPIFTEVEITTLSKLINETKDWRKKILQDIKSMSLTEKPVVLVEDIGHKIAALDREVQYLLNKAKYYRPKPKPKQEENTTTTDGASASSNDTKSSADTADNDDGVDVETEDSSESTEKGAEPAQETEQLDSTNKADSSGAKIDPHEGEEEVLELGEKLGGSDTKSKPDTDSTTKDSPPKDEAKKGHDPNDEL